MRTRPLCLVTSSSTLADRPTRAAGPVLSSGGCLTWRLATGSTKPRPAPEATTNASSWKGRPTCSAPTAAATSAPTAMMPSANVVVTSSATPSTAATISQTIHATMAAPQRNFGAASWRRNAVGAGKTLVP